MKRALYYLSWSFMLFFIFATGVGATGSIWGGFGMLAIVGAMFGIILLGD